MSSNTNVIIGPYDVEATGSVAIVSRGESLYIRSSALESDLRIDSGGTITIYANPLGSILQALGPPEIGPRIQLEPELLTLAVGPPGLGASITLTPAAIVLKVGEVSYSLTAAGIMESVAEVSREVTVVGHNLTAAETVLNVGVEGIAEITPMKESTCEGNLTNAAGLSENTVEGVRTETVTFDTIE